MRKHFYPSRLCAGSHCTCYAGTDPRDSKRAHANYNGERWRCCHCGEYSPINPNPDPEVVDMHKRNLPRILTRSGSWIDYLNPDPKMISVEDIAHALSLLPHFMGHTLIPYSVAAHSVDVARRVARERPDLELRALMHDASEAYTGDCPRPLKRILGDAWRDVEARLDAAIAKAAGFENTNDADRAIIKRHDNAALESESFVLRPGSPVGEFTTDPGEPWELERWSYGEPAEFAFLTAYSRLAWRNP